METEYLHVSCVLARDLGSQNTEEEAFQQLDFALEQGVDFIDTAEM